MAKGQKTRQKTAPAEAPNPAAGQGAEAGSRGLADPLTEAENWATLWQSEFAAMAVDRELREMYWRLIGSSAGPAVRDGARDGSGDADVPPRSAAAHATPGAAAAAAAPDREGGAIQRLERRVDDLERRFAAMERAPV